jgi:glycerol-3-phosphate acyltransferase PlsY
MNNTVSANFLLYCGIPAFCFTISLFLGYFSKNIHKKNNSFWKDARAFLWLPFIFIATNFLFLIALKFPFFLIFSSSPLESFTVSWSQFFADLPSSIDVKYQTWLSYLYLWPYGVGAYLLGAIPFGLIFTHWSGLPDVRTLGSGNIGATNVLRTGKKSIALATLLADTLKGTIAIKIFHHYPFLLPPSHLFELLLGLFTILGHIFPVWIHFKGGKGVATAIGVFFALFGSNATVLLLIWVLIASVFKYSSLASLVTVLSAIPMGIWYYNKSGIVFFFIAFFITLRHKDNLVRLYNHKENKIKLFS